MRFEAGNTYSTRSICDSNCRVVVSVAKRTDKTITTDEGKRLKIFLLDGIESVKPWGSYSMAPIVSADDIQPG